jgi:hypothetical protein
VAGDLFNADEAPGGAFVAEEAPEGSCNADWGSPDGPCNEKVEVDTDERVQGAPVDDDGARDEQ